MQSGDVRRVERRVAEVDGDFRERLWFLGVLKTDGPARVDEALVGSFLRVSSCWKE